MKKRIAAIIPAYNEEKNIGAVLRALKSARELAEIIVVDDGSTDRTADVARKEHVRVVRQENRGKASAMAAGAKNTEADILLFADADLVGLTGEHVTALLEPVIRGDAGMTVGMRDRSIVALWFMEHLLPVIGGERALARDVFLRMVERHASKRFGIETVMNAYCKKHHISVRLVRLPGLSHIIKEVRYGFWIGLRARIRMIGQILRAEISTLFDV
ncbi:glycosyltransferase family 2 protein [Candidatus Uhrbacteria bacterium]|nr:glycosyltransferase family 2 protein [Candidatus Uhrbacteria bacterium]